MRKMISVTDEQTELVQFETFESIKNDINELGINIFKFRNLWSVINNILILCCFGNCDQRLISFELFEKLIHRLIDNRNNAHNLFHDFVLNDYVSFSFNDPHIWIIVLFFINNGVLSVCFGWDFRKGTLKPWVFRVSQRSNRLNIGFKFGWVFCIVIIG